MCGRSGAAGLPLVSEQLEAKKQERKSAITKGMTLEEIAESTSTDIKQYYK